MIKLGAAGLAAGIVAGVLAATVLFEDGGDPVQSASYGRSGLVYNDETYPLGSYVNGWATMPAYRLVTSRGADVFYAFSYPIAMDARARPITRPGVLLLRWRSKGEGRAYLFKLPADVNGATHITAVDNGVLVGHVAGHARSWRFDTRSLGFTSLPA